jgi:hypothetical protein
MLARASACCRASSADREVAPLGLMPPNHLGGDRRHRLALATGMGKLKIARTLGCRHRRRAADSRRPVRGCGCGSTGIRHTGCGSGNACAKIWAANTSATAIRIESVISRNMTYG